VITAGSPGRRWPGTKPGTRSSTPTTSTTWQAKALAQATALDDELTALLALLQPGDLLTKAKAIQADASALAELIKEHQ
jgi:hypothetical protein